jgi:hypothetical protein
MSDFPLRYYDGQNFFLVSLLQNQCTGKTLGMKVLKDDCGFCLRVTLARFQKICLCMDLSQTRKEW